MRLSICLWKPSIGDFFFFNDTATTEIYTLSLHDALPILREVAEHVMLVDLARNDVARVCAPGTRRVRDLLRVDRYSRVMHLVSEVVGTLAPGLDALDAFRASMTMGTLTGAPKLRAAELIHAAKEVRRDSYGGSVGYVRGDGELDTCIVIRSAFVSGGRALVRSEERRVGKECRSRWSPYH